MAWNSRATLLSTLSGTRVDPRGKSPSGIAGVQEPAIGDAG